MITITATESAKIYFKGTTVEIPSVIARIGGTISFDGKTLPTVAEIFESVEAYEANPSGKMEITGFVNFDLSNGDEPETWKPQTVQVAHEEFKAYLEGLGFTAVISGI